MFGQIVIGTIKRVEAAKTDNPRIPVRFVEVQHGFVWGNHSGGDRCAEVTQIWVDVGRASNACGGPPRIKTVRQKIGDTTIVRAPLVRGVVVPPSENVPRDFSARGSAD